MSIANFICRSRNRQTAGRSVNRHKKVIISFRSTFVCAIKYHSNWAFQESKYHSTLLHSGYIIFGNVSSWSDWNNCRTFCKWIEAEASERRWRQWQWRHVWIQITSVCIELHHFECFPKHQTTNCIWIWHSTRKDKGNMHLNQFNDFTIWDFNTDAQIYNIVRVSECVACVISCLMAQLKCDSWLPIHNSLTRKYALQDRTVNFVSKQIQSEKTIISIAIATVCAYVCNVLNWNKLV